MTWLLTGGAGYIGAHVLRSLRDSGRDVVVLDDLSTGVARRVPGDVRLVIADVCDSDAIAAVLTDHAITGVIHLAAKKAVGESVERPHYYYRQNVEGAMSLTEAMVRTGVSRIVYSSSAAVYGSPVVAQVTEGTPTVPVSPYGETKLVGEWIARNLARSEGFSAVALRYFNVAGAGADDLGDAGTSNLVPKVLRAWTQGSRPQIFGDDYLTDDGTCIRDYIHVADVAEAHVAAAALTETDVAGFSAFNIARGSGSSVREVIAAVSRAVGDDVDPEVVARRAGDPAVLVASAAHAAGGLGWVASRDLDEMVRSAWSAWQSHPPE